MIVFKNFIFQVDSVYLWGIFSLFLVFFIAISLTLRFHWNNYSSTNNPKHFIKTVFWVISFVLIILAALSLLTFELIK